MPASRPNRVVIIGGGVIGTACAHYLRQSGVEVTVIDQGRHGGGCSHANCGLISPSHIFPLCRPGALAEGVRALVSSNSSIKIRLRLDRHLWSWLYRFAGQCTHEKMIANGWARHALLQSSRKLYAEIIEATRLECDWEERGCLFVFRSETGFHHYGKLNALMKETYGLCADAVVGDELFKLEPALIPGSAYGAWYFPMDAHMRANHLLASWRKHLEAEGVNFVENAAFEEFEGTSTARVARTSRGVFEGDAFVVATGAWTPLLHRQLELRVPIQPGKGYSITMSRPAVCPTIPMILEEDHVAVTPMQSGYRLGSTMEFAGYDTTLNPKRLNLLRDGAVKSLREPFGPTVEEEWWGWRPMTFDGRPIIDRTPRFDNVMIAAGHNMLGLSMAPATGRLVAELLMGQQPHILADAYRYPRVPVDFPGKPTTVTVDGKAAGSVVTAATE
jgi:D-amino-acid dehydrogenase